MTSKDTIDEKAFPNLFLKVAVGKGRKLLIDWEPCRVWVDRCRARNCRGKMVFVEDHINDCSMACTVNIGPNANLKVGWPNRTK